jgi:hypothetical protein
MEFSFINDVVAKAVDMKWQERTHTDDELLFANDESPQLVEFDMDKKN